MTSLDSVPSGAPSDSFPVSAPKQLNEDVVRLHARLAEAEAKVRELMAALAAQRQGPGSGSWGELGSSAAEGGLVGSFTGVRQVFFWGGRGY